MDIAAQKSKYLSALPTAFYPILAADKAGLSEEQVERWRNEDPVFDAAIRRTQQKLLETLNHRLLAVGMGLSDGNAPALLKIIESVEAYLTKTNSATKIAAENKTLETICTMLHCTKETIVQTIQRRLMDGVKPAKRKILKNYDETNQTKSNQTKSKNKTKAVKDSQAQLFANETQNIS